MTGDRPKMSELLRSATALEPEPGKRYTLTLEDGTELTLLFRVLFSPTRLHRALADELQRIPVNDYREGDSNAVDALEEDLDALLVRTNGRGDE